MGGKTVNVLLVDDHDLFRDGLRGLLSLDERIVVAAECGTALSALEELSRRKVDVALIDLNLPDKDGVWLTREIRGRWPDLPILILSMHDGSQEVLAAMSAGASGYLTKTVDRDELLAAVHTAARGGTHLCGKAAEPVLRHLGQMSSRLGSPELSDREQTILKMVIGGSNNNEISEIVSLSVSRVKYHLSELFQKFGVSDRISLAVEASRLGFGQRPD